MLAIFFIPIILIAVVYFAGPKVAADTSFTKPELPEDLDEHLHQAESRFDDITPGAEKTIHWADPVNKTKTELAFIYFHGFSATRQESMPVPEEVAKHFSANIYYTRLTGNGRSNEAMADGTVNRWVNDASEAMAIAERIGERTVIIGTSTGASIGWWISHQQMFKTQTAAMVFFSPNFGLADARGELLTIRWGRQIAEKIIGDYRVSEPVSEAHEKYWSVTYPTRALLPMMSMVKVARAIDPVLNKIPLITFYSPYDDTVSAEKIIALHGDLTCKNELVCIDNPEADSQHVIVGDILSPQNTDRVINDVVRFLKSHIA